ncbi:MAG: efflux RND transporter periplasmic adaptor subunit [Methylomicrobium sp.]
MTLTNNTKTLTLSAITLSILLLMILWMAGAFQSKIKPETLPVQTDAIDSTLTAEWVSVPVFENATGTLEAKQAGDISAQVQARIQAIHVKSGDTVKPGDLLITLDDEAIAAKTRQARENINALSARLTGALAHYRRTQQLFAQESATRADLDAAKSDYESLKAQKAVAQSQLKEASHIQGFSHIRATYSARVIDRHAEPGEVAYPGKRLLTLYDPSALRIEAHIRESIAVDLQIGQTLEARIDALNLTIPAVIEEIVPSADPSSRNFLIKMRIETRSGLYPGMFIRIRIPRGEERILSIPQKYIHQVGQLDIIWIDENEHIERRFVRLGRALPDGKVKIVSGLSGGEKLINPEKLLSQRY